jgi:hypothetical protein
MNSEFSNYSKLRKLFSGRHIIDLKHMWTEYEETTITNAEHSAQTDHIMDQIENSLTKKHTQVKVKKFGKTFKVFSSSAFNRPCCL